MMNFGDEGGTRDEEEAEEFYDSLDRILSSSCSSTSASTSEDEDELHGRRRRRRRPRDLSIYDVWISEPSSVAERRRRLLWQMGLFPDSSPRRRYEDLGGDCEENGAAEQTILQREMDRLTFSYEIHREGNLRRNSPPSPSISPSSLDYASSNHHAEQKRLSDAEEHGTLHSPPSRPEANSGEEDSDEERKDSSENGPMNREFYFTIKNLNSGEKFVVKELREDGMWKRLREVGTGRQLTMEEFQASVVGLSPIVQELMRRQSVEEEEDGGRANNTIEKIDAACSNGVALISDRWLRKKKGSLLRSLKTVAGSVIQRKKKLIGSEQDTSSEKGGRRSSSTTEDSLSGNSSHGLDRIKVRKFGKSTKDLTALYQGHEIQAHKGAIWTMKFNFDGRYLASAGEDKIIRVWQVIEKNRSGEIPRSPFLGKSFSFDRTLVPVFVFGLYEKPVCSFEGHLDDVLDLSWSKSEYLLSSSMDKTVRLWHLSSNSCLKIFTHSDYVTCIQFNPVDDNYFISGSLDAKVRIWSISDRHVVHWIDLREMITAVCYRPDGQVALVGSHKGSCNLYDTSENKLHRKGQVNMQTKKKRSRTKKITGFQFAPGSSSEVLVTSADSRIRVVNGVDLVHKFKGIRNTSSQITASFTADGDYVICPSEDSHVCVWRYDVAARASKKKVNDVGTTRAFEHFYCKDVTAAIPWCGPSSRSVQSGRRHDRASATWPEEKLLAASGGRVESQHKPAWGTVIVTANRGGEIRTFQNFGRLSS